MLKKCLIIRDDLKMISLCNTAWALFDERSSCFVGAKVINVGS